MPLRDPRAVRPEASFDALYDVFTPFFLIQLGMQVKPGLLGSALGCGGVLLAAAVVGELLGAGGASWAMLGARGGRQLGTSMVPRAEIATIVVSKGRELGPWAVSDELFAGMILVSLLTCLAAPLALRLQLRGAGTG